MSRADFVYTSVIRLCLFRWAELRLRVVATLCTLLLASGMAHAQLFLNVNKSFTPINLNVGQTSSLVITFANTSPTTSATNVAGTDTLPAGLAYTTAGVGTCSLTPAVAATFVGGGTLTWSGGVVPPNSTCTITTVVTALATGTWVNTVPPENVSGNIGGTSVAAFSTASATITAGGSLAPITGVKTASSGVIHGGSTRSYTITLTNPNAVPLSGLRFTDTLPAELVIAVPGGISANSCGGVITDTTNTAVTDGDLGIALNGGTLAPSGRCLITFVVRTADSTTPQLADNITNAIAAGAVSTTQGASNSAFSGSIRIERGAAISKVFTPVNIDPGGTSLLAITLSNYNLSAITNAGLTDPLPPEITGVSYAGASASCGAPTVNVSATR